MNNKEPIPFDVFYKTLADKQPAKRAADDAALLEEFSELITEAEIVKVNFEIIAPL